MCAHTHAPHCKWLAIPAKLGTATPGSGLTCGGDCRCRRHLQRPRPTHLIDQAAAQHQGGGWSGGSRVSKAGRRTGLQLSSPLHLLCSTNGAGEPPAPPYAYALAAFQRTSKTFLQLTCQNQQGQQLGRLAAPSTAASGHHACAASPSLLEAQPDLRKVREFLDTRLNVGTERRTLATGNARE